MWIFYEMDDSSCTAETFINRKKIRLTPVQIKKKKKKKFICFIWFIFFSRLLLWQLSGPKGGIYCECLHHGRSEQILYQHLLIKKSIENIHTAFGVSLGWTVATEGVCGCTAALLRWRQNGTHMLVHHNLERENPTYISLLQTQNKACV